MLNKLLFNQKDQINANACIEEALAYSNQLFKDLSTNIYLF